MKRELKEIYFAHDFPEKAQSHNGGEFEKHVRDFCITNKVKMVRFRPYHSQTQGKVERSHRVLRQKIHYDIARKRKHGINLAKQPHNYARCLNNEKHEELG